MSQGFFEASGPGRGRPGRLHFFVDALVDELGAFIEIFVRVALLRPHPAFPCRARVGHRFGVRDGRCLSPRRFSVWPDRGDRSGRVIRSRATGVGLAAGECQCTGSKQDKAPSGEIAELYEHRLHLSLSQHRISNDGRLGAAGYLPEKIVIRNGNETGSQSRARP